MVQVIVYQQVEWNCLEYVVQQLVQVVVVEFFGQVVVLIDQQQGGDDEGKGDVVVEFCFVGYGVVQVVVVVGVVDLDVVGQYWIGGCEDCCDQ